MQAVLRLLVGLAVITVAGTIVFLREGDRLSADIAARSQKIVSAVQDGWAGMSIVGRDVRLTGNASSVESRDALVKAVDALPGVRRVDATTGVLARQSPYEWKLARQAGELAFSGSIPSEANRLGFSGLLPAHFPNLKVVDTARLAAGAPDNLPALQKFAEDVIAQLSAGAVSVSDKTVKIEGVAASSAAFSGLQDLLTRLPASVTLASVSVAPPSVTPYVFSARKEGQTLALSGLSPSFAARDSLLADLRARFSAISVNQSLQFASPAAPESEWSANRATLLTQLLRLNEGNLSVSDGVVSLSGVAPGVFEREQILAALAKLPPGLSLGRIALAIPETPPVGHLLPPPVEAAEPVFPVIPPPQIVVPAPPPPPPPLPPPVIVPLAWQAERTPTRLVVTGLANAALSRAASRLFASSGLTDDTVAGRDMPPALVEKGEKMLDFLARLESGKLVLNEAGITLSGHAPLSVIRDEILAGIAGLASDGVKIAATITAPAPPPPPPPAPPHRCQSDVDATLSTGVVNFASGRAALTSQSEMLLKAIAEALGRCADAKVEISGHTDNQGDPDDNMELSEERALAVVEWLVAAGISPDRLKAAGYGDTRPVAANDTAEGRAQNRRIEFKLY